MATLTKAQKYLAEGHVKVLALSTYGSLFHVQGSAKDPYSIRYDSEWHCDCPAYVENCAHVEACKLITSFKATKDVSIGNASESLDDLFE